MSATFTVAGLKPYDGEYEFDLDAEFSVREWGWIKRLTEYMPLTVDAGFKGGDPELMAILAVIAIRRSGRVSVEEVPGLYERLIDQAIENVLTFSFPPAEEGAEPGPPAPSSDGSTSTSGDAGRASSESSASSTPPATGHPGSAGSLSGPARLAS